MSRTRLKLLFGGAAVASAFGLIALTVAWATPGSGASASLVAGPGVLDEINIVSQSPTHGIMIKTRGQWDTRVVRYTILPGGHSGWHSHPGPTFVVVTAGTLTKFDAGNPTPGVHPAGTTFVDAGGDVHIAQNEGVVDLQFTAFHLVPKGAPVRIDQPAP